MNGMRRGLPVLVLVFVAVAAWSHAALADDPVPATDVVRKFAAHVDGLKSLDDATRSEIHALIDRSGDDEYSQIEAITAGLARIYPEYEKAILTTQADDVEGAIAALQPLADSGDPFLAADSSFFLARTLMNGNRHEEALPLLDRLAGDLASYTVHAGPALYFTGVAQAGLLDNQRALQAFSQFLDQYPEAPERLRVAAWRQVQTLQAIEEGSMDDVLQRMDYSHRRLEIGRTDEPTQVEQEKIVSILAKMIVEEEKKECSNCKGSKNSEQQKEAQGEGQKPGENQGQGRSNTGGSSNQPNGTVRRTYDNGPASPWSTLRERTRDAANNAIRQKLPVRYRSVVEKYYDTISGNESAGE
jgi:hypothetical protein